MGGLGNPDAEILKIDELSRLEFTKFHIRLVKVAAYRERALPKESGPIIEGQVFRTETLDEYFNLIFPKAYASNVQQICFFGGWQA